MKTLFKQPFPMLVATIVTTATLAACSNEMHPTDVSTGEPQAVTVRFTTPSAGQSAAEDPWQEGDQVTVEPQAQGDPSITFGYTKQEDGTYMWQNILEGGNSYFVAALPASFTAYCPSTEGTSFNIFTLPTISDDGQIGQADQSDAMKLRAADYMTAPPTTVPYGENTLNLTLAHRLCRLTFVVTEYGNEFNGVVPTLEDVKIKSQNRTVNLTYEGDKVEVATTTGNSVWVSPLTDANANDQLTYTAIVTPCALTSGDIELMSLTVNGTTRPVKYKGDLTKLASGSAYTFHLKVGKDYVTVTASGAKEWTGTENTVTSKIHKQNFAPNDLKMGDYYYSDGTWSDGGYREYTDESKVTLPIMPVLTNADNQPRTVIGIVFYVGDIKGDNYGLLDGKFSGGTHGLVAAVQNLRDPDDADQTMFWTYGGYDEFVSDWLISATWSGGIDRPAAFISIKEANKMQGYANTLALQEYNRAKESQSNLRVKPIYALAEFVESNSPPANSSGWYWPSVCELKWMCWGQGSGQSTAGCDLLNIQLQKVSGTEFDSSSWRYWSSTESSSYSRYAWYVYFLDGRVYNGIKRSNEFSVRPVLAF